jgi:hypothetical protein
MNNHFVSNTCGRKWCLLFFMALFYFFPCLSKFELGEFDFRKQPAGPGAREKGRILVEA